jgi:hypothetical protein
MNDSTSILHGHFGHAVHPGGRDGNGFLRVDIRHAVGHQVAYELLDAISIQLGVSIARRLTPQRRVGKCRLQFVDALADHFVQFDRRSCDIDTATHSARARSSTSAIMRWARSEDLSIC